MKYLKQIPLLIFTVWMFNIFVGFEYIEHFCKDKNEKEILLFVQNADCCNKDNYHQKDTEIDDCCKNIEIETDNCCERNSEIEAEKKSEAETCCLNLSKIFKIEPVSFFKTNEINFVTPVIENIISDIYLPKICERKKIKKSFFTEKLILSPGDNCALLCKLNC